MNYKALSGRTIVPVGMVSATLLTGAFLVAGHASADDVIDTATISVPVSCTMSATGTDSHTSEIPNGTVREDVGTTTMKVFCNDSEGFSIYAAGFSDNTLGNTYLRDTSLGQTADILTSTTFSGNSTWAMKLGVTAGTYTPIIAGSSADSEAESGDTDYSTWAEVPSSYTRVAYRNSGTDINNDSVASAEGATLTTTYKAFISSSQPAGTYVGKVKYTMVHPASADPMQQPQVTQSNYICYYPNASRVEGTMGCDYIFASQEATSYYTTLRTPNFRREGYGFVGWSDAYDYATNPNAHIFGPEESISFDPRQYMGDNNGFSIYAVWVPSVGLFQDQSIASAICGNDEGSLTSAIFTKNPSDESEWSIDADLSSVTALTDSRDNQTYAIAKLSDNKCWMIENLRLADSHQDGGETVPTVLTVSNTNNPLNDNHQLNPTVVLKHHFGDENTYPYLSPSSTLNFEEPDPDIIACEDDSPECIDQSVIWTKDEIEKYFNYSFGYGNYYNWYSATAGRGTYKTTGYNTVGDLCPSGWHLPNGYSDFGGLSNSLGGRRSTDYPDQAYPMDNSTTPTSAIMLQRLQHFPNNYIKSGYISGAFVYDTKNKGWYWTAKSSSNSHALLAYFAQSIVDMGANDGEKYLGLTIRCTFGASP